VANSSYYVSGGKSPAPNRHYEAPIDKNPIYRTNDTFKRAYKKDIRVQEGHQNQTDCTSTIWVKFADPIDQEVVELLGESRGRHTYRLACGHEWEGKLDVLPGDTLSCMTCGAEQGYLGFEHEWQHILFKTDPKTAKLFLAPWVHELKQKAPHVDPAQLERFLFYVLNAFDDIRCNSLWELLYPGSADRIWRRWTRISNSRGAEANSENFIAFLFAVALGTPTVSDGPFEPLRPCIEWGMHHIRYKGYQRSLVVARLALNQCLDKLLEEMHPPPPSQAPQQPQQGGQDAQQAQAGSAGAGASSGTPGDAGGASDQGQAGGSVPDGASQSASASEPHDQGTGDVPVPDASQVSNALSSLIRHSTQFDEQENHPLPDKVDMTTVPDAVRSAIAQVFQDVDGAIPTDEDIGQIDGDMQQAIDSFRDGMTQVSPDSQLMADAKAKILFIDVKPENIRSKVALKEKELEAVERMRSVFFRTLGRQKMQRNESGVSIDVDSAIQFAIEPNDSSIFEQDMNNQGFGYLTLCDMSGSMDGERLYQVMHAGEMLRRSLRFPFVDGRRWGFRGGEGGKYDRSGQVWIYRWDRECEGYLGSAKPAGKNYSIPVECGGLTPMHSAIRVASRYLLTQMSPGMAKYLFLLTDGSPCSAKSSGQGLPTWVLQQYVMKEIQWARQRGVNVYTLVIDGGIDDQECRKMFGPPRFWRNASSRDDENSVDRVLQNLVIQNFEKYLRSRG